MCPINFQWEETYTYKPMPTTLPRSRSPHNVLHSPSNVEVHEQSSSAYSINKKLLSAHGESLKPEGVINALGVNDVGSHSHRGITRASDTVLLCYYAPPPPHFRANCPQTSVRGKFSAIYATETLPCLAQTPP